jgi:hypothetical protein
MICWFGTALSFRFQRDEGGREEVEGAQMVGRRMASETRAHAM